MNRLPSRGNTVYNWVSSKCKSPSSASTSWINDGRHRGQKQVCTLAPQLWALICYFPSWWLWFSLLVCLKETDPSPVPQSPTPCPNLGWVFRLKIIFSFLGFGNEIHVSYASLHVYCMAGLKSSALIIDCASCKWSVHPDPRTLTHP